MRGFDQSSKKTEHSYHYLLSVAHHLRRRRVDRRQQPFLMRARPLLRKETMRHKPLKVVRQDAQIPPDRAGAEVGARHVAPGEVVLQDSVHLLGLPAALPVMLERLLSVPLEVVGHHQENLPDRSVHAGQVQSLRLRMLPLDLFYRELHLRGVHSLLQLRMLHPLPHGDEADFRIGLARNERGRHDVHFGPPPVGLLPAVFVHEGAPGLLGKSFDLLPIRFVHGNGDGEAYDAVRALSAAAVLDEIHAVSGAVDARFDLLHSTGQLRERSSKQSELVVAGRYVSGTKFAVNHHVQLGNVAVERHVRSLALVVAPDIVAALRRDDGGVHVDGDLLLRFHFLRATDGDGAQTGESAHSLLRASRIGQKGAEGRRRGKGVHGALLLSPMLVQKMYDGDERPVGAELFQVVARVEAESVQQHRRKHMVGVGVAPAAPNPYCVRGRRAARCVEEFRQKDSSRLRGKASLFGGGFEVERSGLSWHNTVTSLVEFVCGEPTLHPFSQRDQRGFCIYCVFLVSSAPLFFSAASDIFAAIPHPANSSLS